MSQPVKLSDALVLDARLAGELEKRSIAGQVEYWASLGKLVDALIDGRTRTDVLQRSGSKPLSELIATVGTPEGDARLKAYLESEPFPHFDPHPTRKGVLIRTDADGIRSVGRFVDREFVVETVGELTEDGVIDAEYVDVTETVRGVTSVLFGKYSGTDVDVAETARAATQESPATAAPIYRVGFSGGDAGRFEDLDVIYLTPECQISKGGRRYPLKDLKWGGKPPTSTLGYAKFVRVEGNAVSSARGNPRVSGGKDRPKKAEKA